MSSRRSYNQPGRGSTGEYYEVTTGEYGQVWRVESSLRVLRTRLRYKDYVALATLYMRAGSKRTAKADHERRKTALGDYVTGMGAVTWNDQADFDHMRESMSVDLQSSLTKAEFDQYLEDVEDTFD